MYVVSISEYILVKLRTGVSGANVRIGHIQTYIIVLMDSSIQMYIPVHTGSNIKTYILVHMYSGIQAYIVNGI